MELALLLGKSQSYISKIEKGQLLPDAYEWLNFCLVFKIMPESFLSPELQSEFIINRMEK